MTEVCSHVPLLPDLTETSYLKLFDVLTGVLYLVVAGIEAFVIFVAAIVRKS